MDNQVQILDLANLKRVAEACENTFAELCKTGGDDLAEAWDKAELEFMDVANSTAVLALISEIERLRTAEGDAMTYKAGMENVAKQRDQLKSESEAASALIGHLVIASGAMLGQNLGEVVEVLRKEAVRYRWLRDMSESGHSFYLSVPLWLSGIRFRKEDVDAGIDLAMGDGGQS